MNTAFIFAKKERTTMINWIRSQVNHLGKLNFAFKCIAVCLLALIMFSIPACSFIHQLTFITWVLSALFILTIGLDLIIFKKIKIDAINLSLILFCVSALLSTILNRSFNSFVVTPFALTAFACAVYTYAKANKGVIKYLIFAAFVGVFAFTVYFFGHYFDDIIKLNFNRLGGDFGDENDIAIFIAFGMTLILLFILKIKKIWMKVLLLIPFIFSFLVGITTGSKIFIFLAVTMIVFFIFLLFGKKKWWISLIVLLALGGLIALLWTLPFFSEIGKRMTSFFNLIFRANPTNNRPYDASTASRFEMFLDGMTMFLRKPIFGYGVQGFFRSSSFGFAWSHNNISETLCNFGLVGTFFFHFGMIYALYKFSKKKQKTITDYSMFLIILFFIITMISVALNSQKIYAFIIGLPIAYFSDARDLAVIDIKNKSIKLCKNEKNEIPDNGKKVITIIGNNQNGMQLSDGGCIKIRLYKNLLEKNGYFVNLIDLHNWKFRFISILSRIKKSINRGDNILIMAGPNGCRLVIPFVEKRMHKKNNKVVFCPVGVGTIDKMVRHLNADEINNFILKCEFNNLDDSKMKKHLENLSYIVVENNILKNCYEKFYSLSNVVILENFRDIDIKSIPEHNKFNSKTPLKCIFFSRIHESKGIRELIDVVKDINKDKTLITLDIYGANQLPDKNELSKLIDKNISYCGVVDPRACYEILTKYDLFCLPTKYYGEGTPGSLVEALIAGTPVLVSSYSQVSELIENDYNGFIFDINNFSSLKEILLKIVDEKDQLTTKSKNAIESSKKFIYQFVEKDFLTYFGDK